MPLLFSGEMPMNFTIRPARSVEDMRAAAELMAAYAASLPVDLAYQDFNSELESLPGKYAPPKGELFMAWDKTGVPLACVALRPLSSRCCCEMKRLFILPNARGLGLGEALTERVIEAARAMGYQELRLDTLPTMEAAIHLYKAAGFRRIEAYYEPTPPGTIFMGLAL